MIDLSKQNAAAYPIKLVDGTVLKIKKPSQGLLMKMVSLKDITAEEDSMELLSLVYELVTEIFNRNYNNLVFTKIEIEEMLDINTCMLVVQDYLETTVKLLGE